MTISSVDVSAGPYVGNGIADTFEYDFKIFAEDQLRVVQTDLDGARSVLTLNADYTVTGVGSDAGGDVVLTSPLAAGFTLFVRADIDATQETDFESQGGFYPDVHESAIDKLTLLVQQLDLRVDRAVRLDPDAENGNFQFDESVIDRRNKVLRFDNNGDIELVEFGSIEGLQGFKVETVAVTAGTTDVTVPFAYLPNTKTIWVVANGSFVPRSAYTEEPIKIVFQNPLAAGEVTFFGVSTSPVGTADAANISYGGSGNVEDALDSSLQTVATLAELQASPPSSGQAYLRGFASAYDGGGGEWHKTGVTGLTASQTPAQLADIKCTDVNGDEWALRLTDESTALQVGLVDNVDSTAAFLAWAAGVQAAGKTVLPLHAGVTRVESLTAGIPVPGSLIVQGKGKEASTMIWNDTTVGRDLWDFTGSRDFFEARDFTIRGSHDVNRSNINAYPMLVRNTERVIFKNLRSQYSRVMGIVARDALVAVATECSVDHGARDGINLANCDYTVTAGNDISYVDDDAIAVHNQYYSDQRNHICIGNRLKFAQGIKMLGVHVASITGNTLDFCTGNAFDIQTLAATELEGGTPSFAVTVTGNTVSNQINRANIDGLNSAGDIFALSSTSAQAGALTAIPGTRKPDGTIDSPYAYYRNVYQVGDANSTTPIPMSRGFTISNNTVMRNIERTGLLSALGHGKFWMRDGEYDVDLSVKAATNPNFFRLPDTPVFSVNGTGNTFIGGKWFISASGNGRMVDSKLTDTTIYDCDALITAEPTTNQWGLKLEGSEVDLDPYLQHASRNADGSWAGEGALTAMTLQGATGIELVGNTFKNMSRISDYDFNNAVRDGVLLADGNVVWSGVSTRGYSAANKGVGYIPSVGNTRVINYDADPANATFGDITNELRRDAQVQPTAGYYVTGWFVESTPATVAGTDVVYGWLRLTDGSAHVAGTDWKVAKMPLS